MKNCLDPSNPEVHSPREMMFREKTNPNIPNAPNKLQTMYKEMKMNGISVEFSEFLRTAWNSLVKGGLPKECMEFL